ncbi:phosphotransferase family protein [Bacillus suaedaesalsae]|uniref:Aminoglycoside phosphotransferase family protein n=1 Tax=Bacillus suaedaesalsae TaxID=2810349 RepID=A0ABS2DPK6_9BACI|nr:aminoglycoside phosphotransferase family protein [Bacillus suaedaesalsae]MBM6619633.1 aminoglycoside phosphotransferase family protein [Bacillus suaedaesalsae]
MTTNFTSRILEVYPTITIEKAVIDVTGQNNDVVIINDTLVFRFPKYEQGIRDLLTEVKILTSINDVTTLSIPNPTYTSFEELKVGRVFTGYQKINGVTLSKNAFQEVNREIQQNLAIQLVTFLKEVHSAPIQMLQLKQTDLFNTFQYLYSRIQTKLFPFMRKDAQMEVTETFEAFFHNQKQPINQTLIHGDFGSSNILWSPETSQITGIIDFGGSGIGDPAYDLAGLLSSYGNAFYETCISLYPEGEKVSKRVKFYRSTFALQEALHGIEHNDPIAFENGIETYR